MKFSDILKWPVIKPIIALLHNEKVIVALAAVLATLFVQSRPEFAAYRDSLATALIVLGGLLIGGISVTDAANALGTQPAKIRDLIPELVAAVLAALETKTPPAAG